VPDNEPFLLDVALAGFAGRLADDAAIRIALALSQRPYVVCVSPELASWLTGRSAPAIRSAIDRGHLPAIGGVKRYVRLADLAQWAGAPIGAANLQAMLERAQMRRRPDWLAWTDQVETIPLPGPRGFSGAVAAHRRYVEGSVAGA
jgi:hypothetical protein